MESRQDINSGINLKGSGDDAPHHGFFMAPRPDHHQHPHSLHSQQQQHQHQHQQQQQQPVIPAMSAAAAAAAAAPPGNLSGGGTTSGIMAGKKRGRPRKYSGEGGPAAALSPMPISASIPLTGDFSGWKQPRARNYNIKKAQKPEFENLGDRLAYSGGANFTPHVITVNAGEDVAMKVLSFTQQESRAICILSASGSISNVTLRQPNCSGGTLTYEGRFEILKLSGSFTPADNGIVKSRAGGMSVTLAGPDGRVLGGGIAGLLIAASPVQVVLGSFLPGDHQENNKPKKQKTEPVTPVMPAIVNPVQEGGYGTHRVSFTGPPSFHADNIPSLNSTQDPRVLDADNNALTAEGDSEDFDDDDSPSNLEISG